MGAGGEGVVGERRGVGSHPVSSFRDAPPNSGLPEFDNIIIQVGNSRLGCAGPESILPASIRNVRIKIDPPRILFFNQTNLPVSPPFLEFFFVRDGGCNIIINLEPREFVDAVSRRKTIDGLCSMFVTAPHDVLRHAEIELPCFLLARR
jgi:hypothetical protein